MRKSSLANRNPPRTSHHERTAFCRKTRHREIPCRVATSAKLDCVFSARLLVDQHPYSRHQSRWDTEFMPGKPPAHGCPPDQPEFGIPSLASRRVPDQVHALGMWLYKRVGEGSIPKVMFPRTRVVPAKFTFRGWVVDLIRREGI